MRESPIGKRGKTGGRGLVSGCLRSDVAWIERSEICDVLLQLAVPRFEKSLFPDLASLNAGYASS